MKKIVDIFKNFDKLTHKILKHGLHFCFALCLISGFVLLTYEFAFSAPLVYYIGVNLFKLSFIFATEFIICSFVVDGIKNGTV